MQKIKTLFLCLLVVCLAWRSSSSYAQGEYITSVEDACSRYPEQIGRLMQVLDLDKKELEAVKSAYENGDLAKAATSLLAYYLAKDTPLFVRDHKIRNTPGDLLATADSIVNHYFTFYDQTARVPPGKQGYLDWNFKGPADDQEWAWALNRHFHIKTLYDAFASSKNPVYAKAIDRHIQDWVIQSAPYPARKSNTAMWRGLEVSFRAKYWAEAFYGLKDTGHLRPATLLLLLSSLPDHADYARRFHGQGNWLTMEMSGLARLASAWPEFRSSRDWITYTKSAMTESLLDQVYPDGTQTELTSSYHQVALNNFELFRAICMEIDEALPESYLTLLDSMRSYIAYTVRPDGYGLLNNDADQRYNRNEILEAAKTHNREDWRYIATNGAEGKRPPGPPSVFYPWAGHFITRSGYDKDAHWSFFDIGPWGTGHQHNDKLHISVAAYGKELLVDGGRFAYRGEIADKFRKYATGSASHNVLLIDGKGQAPGPQKAQVPLGAGHARITEEYDYAWSDFDRFTDLEGKSVHQRTYFYLRDKFWIVLDKVSTDRPRKVEALWHWHPDNEVTAGQGGQVRTLNERGNLLIRPLGDIGWNVQQVKGQESPVIQGWYSETYNNVAPNMTSIYTAEIPGDRVFGWLLYPYETQIPAVNARIISLENDVVTIRVEVPGEGQWNLRIPLNDPAGVLLRFQ